MTPELRARIEDPANIPMALTPDAAMMVASLMQFALRNPEIRDVTPSLYACGCEILNALIDRLDERNPDLNIRQIFNNGWHEELDITPAEFENLYGADPYTQPNLHNQE
jgi:hypothetical protein